MFLKSTFFAIAGFLLLPLNSVDFSMGASKKEAFIEKFNKNEKSYNSQIIQKVSESSKWFDKTNSDVNSLYFEEKENFNSPFNKKINRTKRKNSGWLTTNSFNSSKLTKPKYGGEYHNGLNKKNEPFKIYADNTKKYSSEVNQGDGYNKTYEISTYFTKSMFFQLKEIGGYGTTDYPLISETFATGEEIINNIYNIHSYRAKENVKYEIRKIKLEIKYWALEKERSVRGYNGYGGTEYYSRMYVASISNISAQVQVSWDEDWVDNEYEQYQYQKIFISEDDLRNKNFTKIELANLIVIYKNELKLKKRDYTLSNLVLDRKNWNLSFDLNIKTTISTERYSIPRQSIKLKPFNFDYITKISSESDPYWKHLDNGKTKYHSIKPKTKIIINEDFLKNTYIITLKENLLKAFRKQNWVPIAPDKNIIINKINDYSINFINYENIKQNYENTKDINFIKKLKPLDSTKKYLQSSKINSGLSKNEFIYLIKNMAIKFDYGFKTIKSKKLNYIDFNSMGIVGIDDLEIRNANPLDVNWKFTIKNLKLEFNGISAKDNSDKKIHISSDNLKLLYDLNLKYDSKNHKKIIHEYAFQTKKITIADDISFITEKGILIDKDFKVVKTNSLSKLKVGDYAYKAIRYWTKISNKKEYLLVEKKENTWWSKKYDKSLVSLDSDFKESNLEYVFSETLQLLINPYVKNSVNEKITKNTRKKYGIDTVTDIYNDYSKILESWIDGKWSHTLDKNGLAIFDGIFGADINGILDSNGRLNEGSHKISITLTKIPISSFKSKFNIVIDKSPLHVNIDSKTGILKKTLIKDKDGSLEELYYSSKPITFNVIEKDIKSIKSSLINSKGQWYQIPVEINTKFIDNKWVQTIDSTIDYAGFHKVELEDQVGNKRKIFFLLQQNNLNIMPDFKIKRTDRPFSKSFKYKDKDLEILKGNSKIILSHPLIDSVGIKKIEIEKGVTKEKNVNSEIKINPYIYTVNSNYKFAKTIGSTSKVLKYAGDELLPLLSNKLTDKNWDTFNKEYLFNSFGMYKFSFKLKNDKLLEKYIYINDFNEVSKVFETSSINWKNEKMASGVTHNSDKGEINIDIDTKSNAEAYIKAFPFQIQDLKIWYSDIWLSNYEELKTNELDYKLLKEGKYKLKIKTINNKIYENEFLILDKSLLKDKRVNDQKIDIYKDYEKPETAFWKGTMVWDGYRYHDKDHLDWIKIKIFEGLSDIDVTSIGKNDITNQIIKKNWNGKDSDLPGLKKLMSLGGFDYGVDYGASGALPQSVINEYWKKISSGEIKINKNGDWVINNGSSIASKTKKDNKVAIITGSVIGLITLGSILLIIRRKRKLFRRVK